MVDSCHSCAHSGIVPLCLLDASNTFVRLELINTSQARFCCCLFVCLFVVVVVFVLCLFFVYFGSVIKEATWPGGLDTGLEIWKVAGSNPGAGQ